jgi:hypothetical protein
MDILESVTFSGYTVNLKGPFHHVCLRLFQAFRLYLAVAQSLV